MNINGKYGYIFHNEKDGKKWINLSDSSKNVDGDYTNMSWSVRFKGEVPKDRSKINYSGFTSYYKPQDKVFVTLQIMEWSYVNEQPRDNTPTDNGELPF
ncbi:hypothetical protein [PinkBerry-associated phage LS06-2018-MD08]|nr:hypothetical protein [PinkBerry-associated phage LS06-2018-MD08]